jgi:cytochrome P450
MPDPDLVPFEPPAQASYGAAFRNVIESYPHALYEEDRLIRYRTRFADSLLVSSPEIIQDILVTRADQFRRDDLAKRLLSPLVGATSLLMAEGPDWRWQRRAVAPTFRHDKLLSLVPTFNAVGMRRVARWQRVLGEDPVDVSQAMAQTTLDVVVDTMLGGAGALDVPRFSQALTSYLNSFPWRFIFALFGAPSWLPHPGRWRATRARDHMYHEAVRLVAQRRQTQPTTADLLDLLLQAHDEESGRMLSDEELARNLLTFILAGHETTAVALTWTLWLLAKYPDVQNKVAEEAQAIAGNGDIEAKHIEQLVLTKRVLQESLRLYPPAPAMTRQPLIPLVLGGEHLTPATQVTITIYPLHRNRCVWQEPNSFDPSRFSVEQIKARPRCAYLPFGAGPRVCIGASFAMIEATVFLAVLLRNFRFKVVSGHRPHPIARVTLRPRGGMPLYIEKR